MKRTNTPDAVNVAKRHRTRNKTFYLIGCRQFEDDYELSWVLFDTRSTEHSNAIVETMYSLINTVEETRTSSRKHGKRSSRAIDRSSRAIDYLMELDSAKVDEGVAKEGRRIFGLTDDQMGTWTIPNESSWKVFSSDEPTCVLFWPYAY